MKLKPSAHLASREIHGEFVVINLDSGDYHIFNRVGGVIWQCLAAGHDREAVVAELTAGFKVSAAQARADVEAFVTRLKGFQLLE